MSPRWALACDIGRERDNNEDHARALEALGLFIVADGMGGHVGGEVASRVAVDAFCDAVRAQPVPPRARDECEVMMTAAVAANLAVLSEAARRGLQGMGTTLTAARLHGRSAIVASVGDSRAYVLTRTRLRALTEDQTLVAQLVARGALGAHEVADHPERHLLIQALGTLEVIEPQIISTTLRRGSRLLLTTDGLHDVVDEREIARLAAGPDLEAAVGALIGRANALGGPDNATVLLVEP